MVRTNNFCGLSIFIALLALLVFFNLSSIAVEAKSKSSSSSSSRKSYSSNSSSVHSSTKKSSISQTSKDISEESMDTTTGDTSSSQNSVPDVSSSPKAVQNSLPIKQAEQKLEHDAKAVETAPNLDVNKQINVPKPHLSNIDLQRYKHKIRLNNLPSNTIYQVARDGVLFYLLFHNDGSVEAIDDDDLDEYSFPVKDFDQVIYATDSTGKTDTPTHSSMEGPDAQSVFEKDIESSYLNMNKIFQLPILISAVMIIILLICFFNFWIR